MSSPNASPGLAKDGAGGFSLFWPGVGHVDVAVVHQVQIEGPACRATRSRPGRALQHLAVNREAGQTSPWSNMASTTLTNPAIFAPLT